MSTELAVIEGEPDRTTYIGGSDVAAIMGLSPWQTPLQCYNRKLGIDQEPITPAKRKLFARGHRWEPVALDMLMDELEDRFGTRPELIGRNQRYRDAEFPFMAAEIDAEFVIDGEPVNVELKTVYALAANKWGATDDDDQLTDEIPIHYAAQAMYGMGIVPGRKRCMVGALVGADTMMPFDLKRDEETIKAIRAKCFTFWTEHVLKKVPPDPINLEDIMRLFAKTNGRPVALDDNALKLLNDIAHVRARQKQFKLDEDELKYQLCDWIRLQWGAAAVEEIKDNAVLTFAGVKMGTWAKQSANRIDLDTLREEQREIAAKYTRVGWTRVLRITKPK